MAFYHTIFESIFTASMGASKGARPGKSSCISGYTIIEAMVAMAIISILACITAPTFASIMATTKISGAKSDLKMIAKEIEIELNSGKPLPESLAEIGLGHMRDPWGNPYQYLKIQGAGKKKGEGKGGVDKARKDRFLVPVNSDFDLYSMGPDGKSVAPFTAKHSRDDIVRANDGGYYGLASLF